MELVIGNRLQKYQLQYQLHCVPTVQLQLQLQLQLLQKCNQCNFREVTG